MEMKANLQRLALKALCLLASLSLILFAAACPGKNNSSPSGGGILSFDETADAGETVREANNILKEIKQRFKDNEPRLEELQNALKEKNPERVKTISGELITQIDLGTEAGKEAINKLRVAQEKNINEDYKEYLLLKTQALEKYVDAFEERRKAAIILRDGYDPKDAARRDQVVGAFKEREEKFKEIMEEARKSSEQANQLAKESMNRKS
jgi:hypothetical protein